MSSFVDFVQIEIYGIVSRRHSFNDKCQAHQYILFK